MGYFDDLFKSEFLFDSEYQQRSDIENLKQQVINTPDPSRMIRPLADRVDRLELLCKSLTELVISKGLATREELSVVTQQLDLADGVEDGKISSRTRKKAPRCNACGRFINPRRDHCVYCNAAVGAAATPTTNVAPERLATCGQCQKEVPERQTYYTDRGLRCDGCYDPGAA